MMQLNLFYLKDEYTNAVGELARAEKEVDEAQLQRLVFEKYYDYFIRQMIFTPQELNKKIEISKRGCELAAMEYREVYLRYLSAQAEYDTSLENSFSGDQK